MIKEKSCGAVIYTVSDGKRLYLIEKMKVGHYSLCKGHVEDDETEHETASREIMEETALSVRFIDGFRETTEYSPRPGSMKTVVFFLAQADSTNTIPQECEVREIFWLDIDSAVRTLTHESDKEVLLAADDFINKMTV